MATAVIWKMWAAKGEPRGADPAGRHVLERERACRAIRTKRQDSILPLPSRAMRVRINIGFMLGFGEGVPPRDDIEAYKWIKLAIDGYTAKNQDRLDQARKGPGDLVFPHESCAKSPRPKGAFGHGNLCRRCGKVKDHAAVTRDAPGVGPSKKGLNELTRSLRLLPPHCLSVGCPRASRATCRGSKRRHEGSRSHG